MNTEAENKDTSKLPILSAEDLSYSYAKVAVLNEISFELKTGEIAFLTGPNGAGKSTLLRCLAGWSSPVQGEVRLCGARLDGSNREQRRLVSFVPDTPVFYDDLTAGEHVRFVLQANRQSPDDDRATHLLEAFGLASHLNQFPSSYSRGMRQKLALVLALVIRPAVLLLDEPYGPLDPKTSLVLSGMLNDARADGTAALISCHHDVPGLAPDISFHLEDGALNLTEQE